MERESAQGSSRPAAAGAVGKGRAEAGSAETRSSGAESAGRASFGSEDVLTRFAPGSEFSLQIDSPWEKPGWRARVPAGWTAPEFPGSAVFFEGAFYEVKRAQARGGRGGTYLLAPWDERFPLRTIFEYSPEACARLIAQRAAGRRHARMSWVFFLLSPILGLLPGVDQQEIERLYNVSATGGTLASALGLLGIAGISLGLGAVDLLFGGDGGRGSAGSPGSPAGFGDGLLRLLPWTRLLAPAAAVAVDSLVRLVIATHEKRPIGSVFVAGPLALLRAVREAVTAGRVPGLSRRMRRRRDFLLREARDEVRPLGEGGGLRVKSLLPKPHWGARTAVRYGERLFCLGGTATEEGTDGPIFVFDLEPAPADLLPAALIDYRPEEVREVFRRALLDEKRTWIETFAPIWGLLDAPRQWRLADLYGFAPLRQTLVSAAALGATAGWLVLLALTHLGHGRGDAADLVVLAGAGYIAVESAVRLRRWWRGEPCGSVLGRLLAPWAERFMID
jgi:hypothetical protein